MEKIDQFFREKLESHSEEPSLQVWNTLEDKLTKKNKGLVWRIAAGIALIAISTYAIVLITQNTNSEITSSIAEEVNAEPPQEVAPLVQEEPKLVTKSNQTASVKVKQKEVTQQNQVEPAIEIDNSVAVVAPEFTVSEPIIPVAEVVAVPKEEVKPIVLVYSLAAIDDPKNEIDKKSGLGKVLSKANEIKNSENAVGNIRQLKDDLFAFEFIKKSSEKNNN